MLSSYKNALLLLFLFILLAITHAHPTSSSIDTLSKRDSQIVDNIKNALQTEINKFIETEIAELKVDLKGDISNTMDVQVTGWFNATFKVKSKFQARVDAAIESQLVWFRNSVISDVEKEIIAGIRTCNGDLSKLKKDAKKIISIIRANVLHSLSIRIASVKVKLVEALKVNINLLGESIMITDQAKVDGCFDLRFESSARNFKLGFDSLTPTLEKVWNVTIKGSVNGIKGQGSFGGKQNCLTGEC